MGRPVALDDLLVGDVMTRGVVAVHLGVPLHTIVELLAGKGVSSVVITDDLGEPRCLVTERDVLAHLARADDDATIDWYRSHTFPWDTRPPIVAARRDTPLEEAIELMLQHRLHHLPVRDRSGELVGIVSRRDVMRQLARPEHVPLVASPALPRWGRARVDDLASRYVWELMSSPAVVVDRDADMGDVLVRMTHHRTASVVQVDRRERPVGIVTDSDILRSLLEDHAEGHMDWLHEVPRRRTVPWQLITCQADDHVPAAATVALRHGLKHLPVVDAAGHLVGVLSEWDVLRALVAGTAGLPPIEPAPMRWLYGGRSMGATPSGGMPSASPKASSAGIDRLELRQLMSTPAVWCPVDATPRTLLHTMRDQRIGSVVLADEHLHPKGIVTEADLVRALKNHGLAERAWFDDEAWSAWWQGEFITANDSDTLRDALSLMAAQRVRRLPIVNAADVLIGVVTERDVLRQLARYAKRAQAILASQPSRGPSSEPRYPAPLDRPVGAMMAAPPVATAAHPRLKQLLTRMVRHRVGSVVIVDGAGRPTDLISEADVIAHVAAHEDDPSRRWQRAVQPERGTTWRLRTIEETRPLGQAVRAMATWGIHRLPVIDNDGRLVGMITERDVLRVLLHVIEETELDPREEEEE